MGESLHRLDEVRYIQFELEYWIPAEDLDDLNLNILGTIDVVPEYR